MQIKTTFKPLLILLFIFTLFSGIQKATAQYTAIPDPAFEGALYLLGHDDFPSDGQVPTSSISGLTSLDISGLFITDLTGIEDFISLETLDCSNNDFSAMFFFDLNLPNLLSLNCSSSNISNLFFFGTPNLTNLNVSNNPFSFIDVTILSSLEVFSCSSTNVSTLNLTGLSNLKTVTCLFNSNMTSLTTTGLTSLLNMDCSHNNIGSLTFSDSPSLNYLICAINNLSSLTVSGLSNLQVLSCSFNNLSTLNLSGLSSINSLIISSNPLPSIDVSGLTTITEFQCSNNLFPTLNLTGLTNLQVLLCSDSPILECIQVDNVAVAAAKPLWYKDAMATYSLNCSSNAVAPMAENDEKTICGAEGEMVQDLNLNLLTNDTDADDTIDPLTIDLNQTLPGIQSTVVANDNSYSVDSSGNLFLTNINNYGTTTLSYTVRDASGLESNVATVTLFADYTVVANDDDFLSTPIDGATGGTTAKVLINDTIYGLAFNLSDFDVFGAPANPAGFVVNSDGTISVAPGTPSGNYSITYYVQYIDGVCSPATATAQVKVENETGLFYVDSDGDGYGDPTAPTVSVPTPGYVANNLDCDDTLDFVYEGATEICYNNIDDNCDGIKSEGCVPVIVNMAPSYDNTTLISNSIGVPALPYSYAGATTIEYYFLIINMSTAQSVYVGPQASRFVTIPSAILMPTTDYTITAAAVINSETLAFLGNTITVSTPNLNPITLSSASCGSSLASLSSTISANPGLNAVSYTFRIRLTSDVSPTPTYGYNTSSSRFIGVNTFSGFPLQNSTSYSVAVSYTYLINSVPTTTAYGAECTITTPSVPLIGISYPSCGGSIALSGQTIAAFPGTNALDYEFRIRLTSDNGPSPLYYYTAASSSRFSSMNAFIGLTLVAGESYTMSVHYSYLANGIRTWTNYGAECILTTPGAAMRMIATPFTAVGYPNPFSNNFNLAIESSSNAVVSIKIYDMLGRMVDTRTSKISELQNTSLGDNFPSGIYTVIIAQEATTQTLRMIKR